MKEQWSGTTAAIFSRKLITVEHNTSNLVEELEWQGVLVGWLVVRSVSGLADWRVGVVFVVFEWCLTSPGFWSAVVLCLCCSAAGACHWGWGLSVWAARNTRKQDQCQNKENLKGPMCGI